MLLLFELASTRIFHGAANTKYSVANKSVLIRHLPFCNFMIQLEQ